MKSMESIVCPGHKNSDENVGVCTMQKCNKQIDCTYHNPYMG